jgi:hypothetical protein
VHVSYDPATFACRHVEAEVWPGVRAPRVLKDAAPRAHSSQRRGETSAIVALDLADSGELHGERLAEPHLSPALAGRMRDNRVRSCVQPGVACLVPRVHAVQAEVVTVGLHEKRAHFSN